MVFPFITHQVGGARLPPSAVQHSLPLSFYFIYQNNESFFFCSRFVFYIWEEKLDGTRWSPVAIYNFTFIITTTEFCIFLVLVFRTFHHHLQFSIWCYRMQPPTIVLPILSVKPIGWLDHHIAIDSSQRAAHTAQHNALLIRNLNESHRRPVPSRWSPSLSYSLRVKSFSLVGPAWTNTVDCWLFAERHQESERRARGSIEQNFKYILRGAIAFVSNKYTNIYYCL